MAPPPGVKVYVTGGSALIADQQIASDRSIRIIEMVTFAVIITMLLLVYLIDTDSPARAGDGRSDAVGDARRGGVPRLSRADRVVDVRDKPTCHARDSRGDGLRHISHRPVPGSAHARRGPRIGLLHDVSRHRARGAGLRFDDRGRDLLPSFTRLPYFQTLGVPLAVGMTTCVLVALTSGAAIITVASRFGLPEPKRAMRIRGWRKIGAAIVRWPGPGPARDGRAVPRRPARPCPGISRTTTTASTFRPTCLRIWVSQQPNAISRPRR